MATGGGYAGLLVEAKAAGFDVNLAGLGRRGCSCQGLGDGLAAGGLGWSGLGGDGGRDGRTHEGDLNRTGGGRFLLFLVPLKFVSLDAVDAGAVFSQQLDLDIMQLDQAFFQLNCLGSVNPVLRMRAKGMRIGDAIGLRLDIDAEAFGQLAQVEGVLELSHGEEDGERAEEQNYGGQHQRSQPLNREVYRGEAHGVNSSRRGARQAAGRGFRPTRTRGGARWLRRSFRRPQ